MRSSMTATETPLATGVQAEPLLNEISRPGTPGHQLPALDVPDVDDFGGQVLRHELPLPEVGDVLRVARVHEVHVAREEAVAARGRVHDELFG